MARPSRAPRKHPPDPPAEMNDFRFEIVKLEEPDDFRTHLVTVLDVETGDFLDSFTTGDPFGAVEAAREAQAYTLEERFEMYADRGW